VTDLDVRGLQLLRQLTGRSDASHVFELRDDVIIGENAWIDTASVPAALGS
jgi:hypothetical protein